MKDVMLDIETLGNGKNAMIVQIGAVYFDRDGNLGETFKVNIDARSVEKSGGEFDANTVYWWLSQSREAINSILEEPKVDIKIALENVNAFLEKADAIWSHATFDFVILTETFKRLGIKTRFHYRACRDIRTLTDLAKVNTKNFALARHGIHHDALDDCIFQIKYCAESFKRLTTI